MQRRASNRNVTVAIGHGYKAAYGIDCYLKGKEPVDHPKKEIATFESLNTWYYSDAPKTVTFLSPGTMSPPA